MSNCKTGCPSCCKYLPSRVSKLYWSIAICTFSLSCLEQLPNKVSKMLWKLQNRVSKLVWSIAIPVHCLSCLEQLSNKVLVVLLFYCSWHLGDPGLPLLISTWRLCFEIINKNLETCLQLLIKLRDLFCNCW